MMKERMRVRNSRWGTVLLALALSSLASAGCDRWRPNTPIEVTTNGQAEIFFRVLAVVRGVGYAVLEQDASSGYIRVAAKTTASTPTSGGWVAAPGSWFGVQVLLPNKVVLNASGYLVRDNDSVRRTALDDEMQELAARLRSQLNV